MKLSQLDSSRIGATKISPSHHVELALTSRTFARWLFAMGRAIPHARRVKVFWGKPRSRGYCHSITLSATSITFGPAQ
jgi:hypothetical protein